MKSLLSPVIAAACIICIASCDFLRTVAGRPVSAQIEQKREALLLQTRSDSVAAAEQARLLDMEKAVRQHAADSVAAIAKLRSESRMAAASELKVRIREPLPNRYCVILGAFSNMDNARSLAARVEAAGYGCTLLKYSNTTTAVAACPSDDIIAFCAEFRKLKTEPFCPSDCWILVNE